MEREHGADRGRGPGHPETGSQSFGPQLMEQMSQVPPTQDLDAPDTTSTSVVDLSAPYVDQLLRLERYERRALSRRKRAVRVRAKTESW